MLLLFCCLLSAQWACSQDLQKYDELVEQAWKLYQEKSFQQSGEKYAEAFVARGNRGLVSDRYNAACSWALAGQQDSAFVQLFKIAEKGNYTNYGHMTQDPDLHSLHADARWPEVLAIVKANKEKAEKDLDQPLVAILDTIYQEDQGYRMQISEIQKQYGAQSPEMQAHWELINKKDAINLEKVKKILDERGWLGPDVVGDQGSLTLFLVVQHADLAVQERYLPMMREAVQKGKAQARNLALLEDRVALRQGKKQIYGSQIGQDLESGEHYVLPLEDPDHVDERRASVGLGPLQAYVSNWGMTWDAEAYKKQLPAIEARQKQ